MSTYPSWRYHATEDPRIITSEAEEAEGWTDSPAAHGRVAFVDQKLPGNTRLTPAPAPAPAPRAADPAPATSAPTRTRKKKA